jgi:hypothetical protein
VLLVVHADRDNSTRLMIGPRNWTTCDVKIC